MLKTTATSMALAPTRASAWAAVLALAWVACAPETPDRPDARGTDAATADSDDRGDTVSDSGDPASDPGDAASGPELSDDAADPAPGPAPAGDPGPASSTDAPPGPAPVLDLETALNLASLPLSCFDHPHSLPGSRSAYLYEMTFTRVPDYEATRAFYGCWDWHSAVNSAWTMIRLLKELPELSEAPASTGPLVREKMRNHITESAIAGELEYFRNNPAFERPYGWAWLIFLHAELDSWDDPQAEEWADRLAPLADLMSDRLAEYLGELEEPSRSGAHTNTAFAIALSLEAVEMSSRRELERALREAAVRFYAKDGSCPTADEPGRSDFLSPCLEEAALMTRVLDPEDYVLWLDTLLPPMDSAAFAPLRTSALSDTADTDLPAGIPASERDRVRMSLGARSHLIGLAFTRADAMLRIAAALPDTDPRVAELRRLARQHAATGYRTMHDAGYAGSHWIGSFALKYLIEAERGPDP